MKQNFAFALAVPLFLHSFACRDRAGDASEPSPSPATPTEAAAPAARGAPPAPTSVESWRFDDDSADGKPRGWTGATGEWRVVADATSPAGGNVLAQRAKSANAIFNVVLVDGTVHADVDITVQLRAIAGRVDQGGGLVWRAADARNYYTARYNPLEDNYRVYFVKNGARKMIESAKVRIDHEAWHTLRVTMAGDQIQAYIDGTKYLDVRDSTFTTAGQIGLWTKADAQTHFDNLQVRAPGAAP